MAEQQFHAFNRESKSPSGVLYLDLALVKYWREVSLPNGGYEYTNVSFSPDGAQSFGVFGHVGAQIEAAIAVAKERAQSAPPEISLLEIPVLDLIYRERARQDAKWGEQNHSDEIWQCILTEEVGELAQAILHARFGGKQADKIAEELVQVAAVSVGWAECLERRAAQSAREKASGLSDPELKPIGHSSWDAAKSDEEAVVKKTGKISALFNLVAKAKYLVNYYDRAQIGQDANGESWERAVSALRSALVPYEDEK